MGSHLVGSVGCQILFFLSHEESSRVVGSVALDVSEYRGYFPFMGQSISEQDLNETDSHITKQLESFQIAMYQPRISHPMSEFGFRN
jgi:hypothetical protein